MEAIALGLFLYGWNRLRPQVHLRAGVVVGFSDSAVPEATLRQLLIALAIISHWDQN